MQKYSLSIAIGNLQEKNQGVSNARALAVLKPFMTFHLKKVFKQFTFSQQKQKNKR